MAFIAANAQTNQFDQFELRAPAFEAKSKAIHQNIYDPNIVFEQTSLLLQDLEAGRLTKAQEIDFYVILGRIYGGINAKELSRYYFTEAIRKYDAHGFEPTPYLLNLYGMTASSYPSSRDSIDLKLRYYRKSVKVARKLGLPVKTASGYNNIGIAYYKTGQVDSASYYYEKALDSYHSTVFKFHPLELSIRDNLAQLAISKAQYDDAIKLFEMNLAISDTANLGRVTALKKRRKASFIGLAKSYIGKGAVTSAAAFLDRAEKIKLDYQIEDLASYERAKFYVKLGIAQSDPSIDASAIAAQYMQTIDSLDRVKVDLAASFSDLMAKAQLESVRLQSESENLQLQKAQTITYFAIACAVLLLIIVISLFFLYRYRAANLRNKERLKDAAMRHLELQEQVLKDEVDNQNKDIKALSGQLLFLKDVNKKINNQLKSIGTLKDTEQHRKLHDLAQYSQRSLQEINMNSLLYANATEVNSAYYERLEKHTNTPLSKGEKEVIALIVSGLSDTQISELRATSLNAIRIARFRIKQKLDLDKETSLLAFLNDV